MTDLRKGPPPIPADLVDYLAEIWPDQFPDKVGADPLPDLFRHAGRLEVIRFLRNHLLRQQQSAPAQPPPKGRRRTASA